MNVLVEKKELKERLKLIKIYLSIKKSKFLKHIQNYNKVHYWYPYRQSNLFDGI